MPDNPERVPDLRELLTAAAAIISGKAVMPWRVEQNPNGTATIYGSHRDGVAYSFVAPERDGVAAALLSAQMLLPLLKEYMVVASGYEKHVRRLTTALGASTALLAEYEATMKGVAELLHDDAIPVEHREALRKKLLASLTKVPA